MDWLTSLFSGALPSGEPRMIPGPYPVPGVGPGYSTLGASLQGPDATAWPPPPVPTSTIAPGPAVLNDNMGGGGSPAGLPYGPNDINLVSLPRAAPPPMAAGQPNSLLSALRGVQAPAAPVAQRVATPHAPAMAKIPGGELVNLLASLGISPAQLPRMGAGLGGR